MKRAAAIALAILLLTVPAVRAQDVRDPGFVSRIIGVLESPQLEPGRTGVFRFNFTNPYPYDMSNTLLNVSIYQYATIEESLPVDPSWPWAYPQIAESSARMYAVLNGSAVNLFQPRESLVLQFTILTSADMPHGSIFAQSAYFLRFWLEFDMDDTTGARHYVMASKGHFSTTQWEEARVDPLNPDPNCNPTNATNRCIGNLNLTRLGVDGVIPDSLFGVKEPIPLWPFYGLLVATALFLVLAFLFWVEENPGKYPRVERAWLVFKGRLRRIARLPRRHRI